MTTVRGDAGTIRAGVGDEEGSGTVHARGGDISSGFGATPSGTVHVSGPDIISGHDPSPISAGLVLNVGDSVILNKVDYRYQGVISKSSGEAEIFLISNNGNKCVFKLYYPNFKPKEDILKQLKQLKHEDIINVIDYGYHHDRFFEIMDYAEGGTIEKYLPIRDTARIKQIIAETINAYNFCHSHGIIHKDIKPQNFYFKNADGTDLLIGDFGISTLLETGMSRHLTSQSLTVGYAAPEMYGIGNKVYIGKEVDYYALGITLIHIWDGKSPFDGLGMHAISNLTTSGKVRIPEYMPREMQKLVKGLITVDYTKRWGYAEIQRWLKGEDVPVHFQIKEVTYPPYQFGPNETATTAEELADILKKSTDKGKKHLYSGKLSAWVNLFNQGLAVELDRIIEDDYPKDQDAGIQKAIYILNPDEPFTQEILQGEKGHIQQRRFSSRTPGGLAYVLERGFAKYTSELSNVNHSFYLYLEAHDAQKEADTFRKYFKTFSPKKALNTIILELRGRDKFKLDDELFFAPDELLRYKDQQFLVNELKDTESALSLWIEGSDFQDIKKQVEKWRKLNKKDIITFSYALSQKNNPFLSDFLKELNYEFIIPDELNKALQSDTSSIFIKGIDQLFSLYDSSLLIEKAKYQSFIDETIVPQELTEGIHAKTIDQYTDAANSLNEMMASSVARMSKAEYQAIIDNYRMPASILRDVKHEKYHVYQESIERMRRLKRLTHADYENINYYLLPKELLKGLASDDTDVFETAILRYVDPLKMSESEYQQIIDTYKIPANIINGVHSDNYQEYKESVEKIRRLKQLTCEDFDNLKYYLLPKELLDGLAGDDVEFKKAVKKLRDIDGIKLPLSEFKEITEKYYCPKDLIDGLTSNSYDVYIKALDDLRDLKKNYGFISKEEYRKIKRKYFVPREIDRAINSDTIPMYEMGAHKIHQLQINGKSKLGVALGCLLLLIILITAMYYWSIYKQNKKEEDGFVAKLEETSTPTAPNPAIKEEEKTFVSKDEIIAGSKKTVIQPGPNEGKNIWVTNVYDDSSKNDNKLKVGGWADYYHSLIRFKIKKTKATKVNAKLYLYCFGNNGGRNTTMYLDLITSEWHETTKWKNKPDTKYIRILEAPAVGSWYLIDITDLYNLWRNGKYQNYGIQLRPVKNDNNFNLFYSSRENERQELRPKLIIQEN